MSDNLPIRGADGIVRQVATDEVSPNLHVQRTKQTFGADGTSTDVSADTPLPSRDTATKAAVDAVTAAVNALRAQVGTPLTNAELRASAVPVSHGGLTDTQLRAAAVPVDSELPAAAALDDAGANATSVPSVGSRNLVFGSGGWERQRSASANSTSATGIGTTALMLNNAGGVYASSRNAADGLAAANVLAIAGMLRNQAAGTFTAPRAAISVGDAEDGGTFAPAANMDYSPEASTWVRRRIPHGFENLASTTRTASAAGPSVRTYDSRGLSVILSVTGVPATVAANEGLVVNVYGRHAAAGSPTVKLMNGAVPIQAVGVFRFLIYPGLTGTQIGARVNTTANLMFGDGGDNQYAGYSPMPTTPHVHAFVNHANSTQEWTYSIHLALLS